MLQVEDAAGGPSDASTCTFLVDARVVHPLVLHGVEGLHGPQVAATVVSTDGEDLPGQRSDADSS